MTGVETEDLVLLALSPDPPPTDRTIGALTERLGVDSLSDRVDLVATVEALRASGAVERVANDAGDGTRTRFRLTDAGRARADAVHDRFASRTITVVEGDSRRDRTLTTVAEDRDRSPVAVAADLSEGGVYHAGDTPSTRFVDREAERRRCRATLSAVRADSTPRALVVTGPPGVGKTTLADRLFDDVDDWHRLRARAGSAGGPYGPVRDLLAADGTDPETVFEDEGPEAGDATELAAQRSALFESVLDRLCPPDADGPRLLLVDDFHNADRGTVAFVRFLLSREHDRPVAVLLGVRPGERVDELGIDTRDRAGADGDDDPAETAAGVSVDAIDGDRLTRVELAAFDREHTRELIEREVGRRGAPAELVDVVYERTGGNPLFVVETVASLLDADRLDRGYEWYPASVDEVDLPSAVESVVDRRVERFDDRARGLLRWAATAGEGIPVSVLEAVADSLDETTISNYLAAFADAGLVEWVDDEGRPRVAFRSEVVREVLYDALDPADRRRRHRAIADAMAERIGPEGAERTATVAHHYRRAGEDRTAVEWFRRAADRALGVYAHETALDHLGAALEIARDDEDLPVVDLALDVASVHETLANYEESRRFGQFALEHATTSDRRRGALARLASVATEEGANERAVELADRGLGIDGDGGSAVDDDRRSVADDGDDRSSTDEGNGGAAVDEGGTGSTEDDDGGSVAGERAEGTPGDELACRLLDYRATAQRQLGRYDAARSSARRQRAIAESLEDERRLGEALKNLGTIADFRSDYDAANDYYERSRRAFEAAGDRHGVGKSTNNLGLLAALQGEYDRASEHLEEALSVFRSVGARRDVTRALTNLGMVEFRRGNYEAARERFETAAERERSMGARQGLGSTLNNLGLVAIEQGRYDDARERFERCLDLCSEVGDRHGTGKALNNLGQVAIVREDYDTARQHFEEALDIYRDVESTRDTASVLMQLGSIERRVGNLEAAADYYDRALSTFRDVEARHDAARARSVLGSLRHELGDTERALEHLEAAESTAETVGDRPLALACRAQWGVIAWDRGDPDAGIEAAEELLGILDASSPVSGDGLDPAEPLLALVDRADRAGRTALVEEWCTRALSVLDDRETGPYRRRFRESCPDRTPESN